MGEAGRIGDDLLSRKCFEVAQRGLTRQDGSLRHLIGRSLADRHQPILLRVTGHPDEFTCSSMQG